MSATKWKTRGFIRPYSPRGWKIPHGGLCNPAEEALEKPGAEADDGWLREVEPAGGGFIVGSFEGLVARHR